MKLKDKLESAKIRYFADPIHYEGRNCGNRTAIKIGRAHV